MTDTLQIIYGWLAYMLMENSGIAMLFVILLLIIAWMLWHSQSVKDDYFDLRDIICSWDDENKRQIVSTNKSLLAGAFLVSSFYVLRNHSDAAFGIYIGAWVLNGGIAAWQKTKMDMPKV
jgi:heme A synthase